MSEAKNSVISIYTEQTPNPENIKFVVNQMLYNGGSIDFPTADSVDGQSPFAEALFGLSFVKNIFIANNFVTIGKNDAGTDWYEIIPEIKESIKNYLQADNPILNEAAIKEHQAEIVQDETENSDDTEMVGKIKDLLQKYVQPAVEMDGGAIVFKSYKEGIVTVGMQGACSGCPSSTITLKAGIEGMMKRMIPEVKEVVAEAM